MSQPRHRATGLRGAAEQATGSLWIALLDRHGEILQASDKRLLNHVLPHVPTQQSHSEILGPYRSQFALAPTAASGQEVLLFVPAPPGCRLGSQRR